MAQRRLDAIAAAPRARACLVLACCLIRCCPMGSRWSSSGRAARWGHDRQRSHRARWATTSRAFAGRRRWTRLVDAHIDSTPPRLDSDNQAAVDVFYCDVVSVNAVLAEFRSSCSKTRKTRHKRPEPFPVNKNTARKPHGPQLRLLRQRYICSDTWRNRERVLRAEGACSCSLQHICPWCPSALARAHAAHARRAPAERSAPTPRCCAGAAASIRVTPVETPPLDRRCAAAAHEASRRVAAMPPKKKQKTLTKKEIRIRDNRWKAYGDAIKDAQGGVASPMPTDPKDLTLWDWSNAPELFDGTQLSLEELGTQVVFLEAGGKGGDSARRQLHGYMREKIVAAEAAPAEAAREAERTAEIATLKEEGLWLGDSDFEAQIAARYDPATNTYLMSCEEFYRRGGDKAAYNEAKRRKDERTVKKAEDDGKRRVSERKVTTPDWLRPGEKDNEGKAPWGHRECNHYWRDKDADSATAIACVEEAMGKRKLEDLGVAVADEMLKTEASNETWQRGEQDSVSRCLTNAARTFQLRTWLAKLASERHWRRLAARRLASRRCVLVLGDVTNDDSLPERALLCDAALGDDVSLLHASVVAGGDDTRMEDVSPPRSLLAASLVAAGSDVDSSGGADRDDISGTARGLRTLDGASSIAADVAEPSLDPREPGFISQVVRDAEATPRMPDAAAALDALSRSHTPTGRLGEILEKFELMRYDPTSDECVGGPAYERMRAADARKRKKTRTGGGVCEFYIFKVLLLALARAFVAGRLKFDKMALTLYYCVFGRYFWAELFWTAGFTMLDALRLGLPLDWIPMEVRVADLPLLPRWVELNFPNGITIASSAVLLELCQATNQAFFDKGKSALYVAAHAAFFGGSHQLTLAALADVGAGSAELAAPRVAACELEVVAYGGAASSVVSGGVSLALGGSDVLAAPTLATATPVFASRADALAAAAKPFEFEISFAKPAAPEGAPRWTEFHKIGDLIPALAALSRHNSSWDQLASSEESWVRQSDTVRVMETAAQLVFAGLDIEDIAEPISIVNVFNPHYQCQRNTTYTIWAGVDFEVKMPDGRILSKREFLKEVMKKHAAAAAA
ncbi:unnamed protein product [Pelagomonas calceolata]|uniref:Uncharacterized protein n=2 Tax=Pelagomonas calceolata TaxID=35677 RepID=A0A8J2S996_9STRA|nr:unnamed protein product [Pelagomonas calceolata]